MGDLLWHCLNGQGKGSTHHLHGARKGLGFFGWYLTERQSFTPFQASALDVNTGCADRRQLLLAQQVMQPKPNTDRKSLNKCQQQRWFFVQSSQRKGTGDQRFAEQPSDANHFQHL